MYALYKILCKISHNSCSLICCTVHCAVEARVESRLFRVEHVNVTLILKVSEAHCVHDDKQHDSEITVQQS